MNIIAIMSGSSLDGIDIGYVSIESNQDNYQYQLLESTLSAYSPEWKERLYQLPEKSAIDYVRTKAEYSQMVAHKVNQFIIDNRLSPDLISWHGHTIFHSPEECFSEQIGEGGIMASICKTITATDFRINDIALGGQGAPIAPIVEKLLFPNYEYYLNIGGIANTSIHLKNKILAFDNCPANQLLNYLSSQIGLDYDEGGELAKKGTTNFKLLEQLSGNSYFKKNAPKSLDNNWIREYFLPLIDSFKISVEDKLSTVVDFIVSTLVNDFTKSQETYFENSVNRLLVTGGGAFNTYLISELKDRIKFINLELIIPDSEIIEYKETILMALMGFLRYNEEISVLSSVTGAKRNSIGGSLYLG